MAEVIPILGDPVYECKCGCQDFWIIPPLENMDGFSGFQCQGCERNFAFPEAVARLETLMVDKN